MRDIGERSEKSRNEGWAIILRGVEAACFSTDRFIHGVNTISSVENFLRGFLAICFESLYFALINDQCI